MRPMNVTESRAVPRTCLPFLLPLLFIGGSAGCGGHSSPDCSDQPPAGCPPTPGPLTLDLKWSVSDPANVTIGNTQNVDYGVATCINAAPTPVTVTSSGPNKLGATIMGTSTLTCK